LECGDRGIGRRGPPVLTPPECGRARREHASDIRLYYPCVIADRRIVRRDFCFRFSRSVLSLLLVPQKAASAAGSEAGMDCGTALAKQARLHPYGEALRRRIFARPRAPAPAAEGRVGEKSGSQSGFGRKPLKSLDSWKKEAWISLPLALNFLPKDLDFPSPGFENPSAHSVKYSRLTWNSPHLSRSSSSAGPARHPFSAREAPAVQDVNAIAIVLGRGARPL
jgi:hypothetical protein